MKQLEQKEQKLNEKENSFLQLLEELPLSVLITKKALCIMLILPRSGSSMRCTSVTCWAFQPT